MAHDYPRLENGNIDWEQERANEVAKGNRCKNEACDAYIMNLALFGNKVTHAQECVDCRSLDSDKDAVTHDFLLRCPHCGVKSRADEEWEGGIYNEDTPTSVCCYLCEKDFEVETLIHRTYRSPEMKGNSNEGTNAKDS